MTRSPFPQTECLPEHRIPRHVLASAWFGCCQWCGYHHPQLVVVAPTATSISRPRPATAPGDALGGSGGGQRHGALAGGQCGQRRSITQDIGSWDHGRRGGTGTHGRGGQEDDFCAFGIEVESRTKTRGTGVLEEEVASQRKIDMVLTEGWSPSEVYRFEHGARRKGDMGSHPNLWRWRMRRWPFMSWQLDQDLSSTCQWYGSYGPQDILRKTYPISWVKSAWSWASTFRRRSQVSTLFCSLSCKFTGQQLCRYLCHVSMVGVQPNLGRMHQIGIGGKRVEKQKFMGCRVWG